MLPTFIVIGAMQAGTTALYEYLRAHPQVYMAAAKELDFFNQEGSEAMYSRHFERSGEATAVGEVSPNYSRAHLWPETAGRMAALVPEARIVYLVRDPIERIRATYLHLAAEGLETRPFAKAVDQDDDYVLTSSYAYQLEAYLAHFPRESLLVFDYGELRYRRHQTLVRLYDFIGVDSGFHPPQVVTNPEEEHRQARGAAKVLQRRRAYRSLLNRSRSMRRMHLAVLTREVEAEVTPRLRRMLASRLEGDVARLRELVPGLLSWEL